MGVDVSARGAAKAEFIQLLEDNFGITSTADLKDKDCKTAYTLIKTKIGA